jgi:XisI protein
VETRLTYQTLIKDLLLQHAAIKPAHGQIDSRVAFDDKYGNYILIDVGWNNQKCVHGSILHLELVSDKIWIHYDGTEEGIATELVEAGVPKEDIVLGFQPAKERPYTGFAIA